jgi:hypothetical protein
MSQVRYRGSAILFCLLLLWSCSRPNSSIALCKVSGSIELDGTPIEDGYIAFLDPKNVQRSYGAPIKTGRFSLALEPGVKRIEVTAQRLIPGKTVPGPSGGEIPAMESYIPEKYNRNSELTIEIPPSGSRDLELKLVSP